MDIAGENISPLGRRTADKPGKGRPFEIHDWELQSRREDLLRVFQMQWASFAWELGKAETVEQARKSLMQIDQPPSVLEPFLQPKTRATTLAAFRNLRRHDAALRESFPAANEERNESERALNELLEAMQGQTLDARVFHHREAYQRRHRVAKRRLERLRTLLELTQQRLANERAFLAQQELLSFIRSNRYELTPRALASALAGVPEVQWRQSIARCKLIPEAHPYDEVFAQFEHVRRALKEARRDADDAVAKTKAYLMQKRLQKQYSIKELRQNWHYLKEAIHTIYCDHHPLGSKAYRVFTEYQRRTSCTTPVDRVLAREGAL